MAKEVFYVRNRRPNTVRFTFEGARLELKHRGHREDSISLPSDAKADPTIARWLRQGVLEEISREAFNKLASRRIDVTPNEYLNRPVRSQKGWAAPLVSADGDATNSLTQIPERNTSINATPSVEWAGELMSTDEELEEFLPDIEEQQNYPSRHREDAEAQRGRGY